MHTEDFEPVFTIGFYKGDPAITPHDYTGGLRSSQIAAFMVSIVDHMVDSIDEKDQNEFEQQILEAFHLFLEKRHEHIEKFKL